MNSINGRRKVHLKDKQKINHGDTGTLSHTGIFSVFLCELGVSVVKKTN